LKGHSSANNLTAENISINNPKGSNGEEENESFFSFAPLPHITTD